MRTILPFPSSSPDSPSSSLSLGHVPWCDVESHVEYAEVIDYPAGAGCTSPIRIEVLDGRHRVAGYLEQTGHGPVIKLTDAPTDCAALTPAAVEQLAAFLRGLVDLAVGGAR